MSQISFVKHFVLNVTPMTYGELLEEMEVMDPDETVDPGTEGYYLENSDGTGEWIVAEEFEADHLEVGHLEGMEPYQQRLLVERAIVQNNYNKLKKSFASTTFLALPFLDREMLQSQERAMRAYLNVLNKRVNAFLH